MATLKDFISKLATEECDAIVQEFFFDTPSQKVSIIQKERIVEEVRSAYGLKSHDLRLHITGSAHLGFSLVEKPKLGLARYRPFSAESDIDCAVVSARLFTMLWREVSRHGHGLAPWPNSIDGLGNYMIYGWLRPDKLPIDLYYRNVWWDCFSSLTKNRAVGFHKIAGGLFYSTDHLKQYIERSVRACQSLEKMK